MSISLANRFAQRKGDSVPEFFKSFAVAPAALPAAPIGLRRWPCHRRRSGFDGGTEGCVGGAAVPSQVTFDRGAAAPRSNAKAFFIIVTAVAKSFDRGAVAPRSNAKVFL